jgi:N-acetylglucosamine-6-sulfatase
MAISRRTWLLALSLMVGVLLALPGIELLTENERVNAQVAQRPNIVFVMSDDLDERSMEDLPGIRGVMGTNGTTFENAYVTFPLCCPSRATILRGQYPHNHRILHNVLPDGGEQKFRDLGLDRSTVATWLKGAGYRTSYIGKYLNGYGGGETYIPPGWDEWFVLNRTPREPSVNDNGQSSTITGNSTDVFAEEASDFIRRSSANPEPFFAVVGTHAPHQPPAVAERHQGTFANTPLPKPLNFDEEDISDKPRWLQQYPRLSQTKIAELQQLYRERLRSMLAVEDLLRKVVTTLHETGELSNTYIFFTSDNGYDFGNHRLYPAGKLRPYEEDIGIPLMVRGPGVPAGEVRKQLVINNDFAPTIAHLAGASIPAFVDGSSFAPLLSNSPPSSWRTAFLEEETISHTHRGVHTQTLDATGETILNKYMFVEYDTGERELYDLKLDPYQLQSKPRAGNEQLYSELQTRLNSLKACAGTPRPDNPNNCRDAEWATGTTTPPTEPPPPTTDRPGPPSVTSTDPGTNATGVATTTNVTAFFSEEMMASSINGTTFKLTKKGSTTKIGAVVTYFPDDMATTDTVEARATLDPTNSLRSGVTYKAVVTTGAKDSVGNALAQQYRWFFTVS